MAPRAPNGRAEEAAEQEEGEEVGLPHPEEEEEEEEDLPILGLKDQEEELAEETSPLPTWLEGDSLGPFISTPKEVLLKVLKLAQVTRDDVVYDLGCGDGRLCIAAALKYGCRAVGVEIESQVAELARHAVELNGVGHLVEIRQEDLQKSDISDGTVFIFYLLPDSLDAIKPLLIERLQKGGRIVSIHFPLNKEWRAIRPSAYTDLYLYHASSLPPQQQQTSSSATTATTTSSSPAYNTAHSSS
ncbi:Class I SAM-dependent methyltransferase [Balamuthia mandrillaris]